MNSLTKPLKGGKPQIEIAPTRNPRAVSGMRRANPRIVSRIDHRQSSRRQVRSTRDAVHVMRCACAFAIPCKFGFPAFDLTGDCWPWAESCYTGDGTAIDQVSTFFVLQNELQSYYPFKRDRRRDCDPKRCVSNPFG